MFAQNLKEKSVSSKRNGRTSHLSSQTFQCPHLIIISPVRPHPDQFYLSEMGCQQTKIESVVPNSWMELFAAMKLSKNDVLQLYKTFQKVDFDHSGSVDIVEMLTLLDVERTRFTEHVFTVFDSDGSGKIDFKEFVLALWNYCTIGQSSLGSLHHLHYYLHTQTHTIAPILQICSRLTCTTRTRAASCPWRRSW